MAKRGFTLIELLIVITIISILTVIAMGNFMAIERQTRIGFAADTVASMFREAQTLAKSGQLVDDGTGKKTLLCRAVKIVPGEGVYSAQTDYVGLPDVAASGAQADTCKTVSGTDNWRKNAAFEGQINVLSAQTAVGSSMTWEFYFKPPFGQILVNNGGVLANASAETVSVTVGTVDQPDEKKTVEFDMVTGVVKRT